MMEELHIEIEILAIVPNLVLDSVVSKHVLERLRAEMPHVTVWFVGNQPGTLLYESQGDHMATPGQLITTGAFTAKFKSSVEREWAWLVYSGLWMEPLRAALDSFIETTQKRVTGKVRLKLYKGNVRVVGRSSKNALYKLELSTYNKGSTFDQRNAVGFIELWGLQARVAAKVAGMSEGRTAGYQRETPEEIQ